ncbi:MAG: hypothetical protein H0W66_10680 [Chthoniobacterales bacterium]|nr:hypothetical protein [Chthoniobacterales bacterium]
MGSCKKDLFINSAQIDNQPMTPEHESWISRFYEMLEALLSMRLCQSAEFGGTTRSCLAS